MKIKIKNKNYVFVFTIFFFCCFVLFQLFWLFYITWCQSNMYPEEREAPVSNFQFRDCTSSSHRDHIGNDCNKNKMVPSTLLYLHEPSWQTSMFLFFFFHFFFFAFKKMKNKTAN